MRSCVRCFNDVKEEDLAEGISGGVPIGEVECEKNSIKNTRINGEVQERTEPDHPLRSGSAHPPHDLCHGCGGGSG